MGSRFPPARAPSAWGTPHPSQLGSGPRDEQRGLTSPGPRVSGRQRCSEIVLTPSLDGNHQVIVGAIIRRPGTRSQKAGQAERGWPQGSVSRRGSLACRIRPRVGAGGLGHGRGPFGGDRCGENREIWLMSASGGRGLSPTPRGAWHVPVVARLWLRSPPRFPVARLITEATGDDWRASRGCSYCNGTDVSAHSRRWRVRRTSVLRVDPRRAGRCGASA